MHFHDTLASLPMTRAEEHKRARLKLEVGVRLTLEARQRVEEEHAWLEAEDEARPVEEGFTYLNPFKQDGGWRRSTHG